MSTVPRRLDINNDPLHICHKFDVYLDDVKQSECTVADADAGYVMRQRRHPLFGTLLVSNGKIITRRVNGVVRIERKA